MYRFQNAEVCRIGRRYEGGESIRLTLSFFREKTTPCDAPREDDDGACVGHGVSGESPHTILRRPKMRAASSSRRKEGSGNIDGRKRSLAGLSYVAVASC